MIAYQKRPRIAWKRSLLVGLFFRRFLFLDDAVFDDGIARVEVQDCLSVTVGAVADDILVPAVFLEGDAVLVLAVFVVIALFIAPARGLVHPGFGIIDIVVPASVIIGRAHARGCHEAGRLIHARPPDGLLRRRRGHPPHAAALDGRAAAPAAGRMLARPPAAEGRARGEGAGRVRA